MPTFDAGATGLTPGVTILDSAGSVHVARTTAGITEPVAGSGIYYVADHDVAATLTYVWDVGVGTVAASETLYAGRTLLPNLDAAVSAAKTLTSAERASIATAVSGLAMPGLANYIMTPGTTLDDFETGWAQNAGTVVDNTTQYRTGTKSLKITALSGGFGVARKTVAPFIASTTGAMRLWVYVHDDPADIQAVTVALYSDSAQTIGAGVDFYGTYHKGWNHLCIGLPEWNLSNGFNWANPIIKMSVFIRAYSGSGKTPSVSFDSLISGVVATPVCVISFDDGNLTDYETVLPLLAERGMVATNYVVRDQVGDDDKLTTAHLAELYAAGHDIANHSKTHPILTTLTEGQLVPETNGVSEWLEGLGLPRGARHFAYPAGFYNDATLAALATNGMLTGRQGAGIARIQPLPLGDPFQISYIADNLTMLTTLPARLAASGGTAHVAFHRIRTTPTWSTDVSTAVFTALLDALTAHGIVTRTISQCYREATGGTPLPVTATDYAAIVSQLGGVRGKTDTIPASPAAVGSAMTLTSPYDAAKSAAAPGAAMALTSAYDKAKDDVLTPLAIVGDTADAVLLKTSTLGGAGAIAWPYTLTMNGTTPIADAAVWVTSDEAGNNVVASGRTDDFGALVPVPNLDAGTYYFWAKKSGVNFTDTPDTEVVA